MESFYTSIIIGKLIQYDWFSVFLLDFFLALFLYFFMSRFLSFSIFFFLYSIICLFTFNHQSLFWVVLWERRHCKGSVQDIVSRKFLDARKIRPSPVSKFHTWYGHTVNGGQKIGEPFVLRCISPNGAKANDLTGSQSKLSFIEEIWPHKFYLAANVSLVNSPTGWFFIIPNEQWKRAPGWFRVSVRNEILHSYVRIVS